MTGDPKFAPLPLISVLLGVCLILLLIKLAFGI